MEDGEVAILEFEVDKFGEIYRGSGSNGDVEKYRGVSHFVSLAAIRSFLVVSSSVTGKFKDFSSKVLHDSGEIYRGSGSNGDVEKYTGASHFCEIERI